MADTISLGQVYDELKRIERQMVTKEDLESLTETIRILGNPELMKQIGESIDDIKHGRVKEVSSVQDMLSEDG